MRRYVTERSSRLSPNPRPVLWGVPLALVAACSVLHAATAPGPLSPKDVVAAILAGKPLPTGEDPADYIRRADSPPLREAITKAYVAAAEPGLPAAGPRTPKCEQRTSLMRALAEARALDFLGKLVTDPPTNTFDILYTLKCIPRHNVGAPFLRHLEAHSDAVTQAVALLPEKQRAKSPSWLAARKRLHVAYESVLSDARDHPDDSARQLTAALVRNDTAFEDLPVYVWIRKNGLTSEHKTTLLTTYRKLKLVVDSLEGIDNSPGADRLFIALLAAKATREVIEAATLNQRHFHAHGFVQTIDQLCPDAFTVAVFSKLAETIKDGHCAGEARTLARMGRAFVREWSTAQTKLKPLPKDIASLRTQSHWCKRMAAEAKFFGDAESALSFRKRELEILDFILACGDSGAITRRAYLNERFGNYRLAAADVDRLILATEDDSLQFLAGLRAWRDRLLRQAAEAEKP